MDTQPKNTDLIAFCGLYCANCAKYKKDNCPGCAKNEKASWCKIRSCCIEKGIANCSKCTEYEKVSECGKYNNFIAKAIELFSGTSRALCINYLQHNSAEHFCTYMDKAGIMSMKKKNQDN